LLKNVEITQTMRTFSLSFTRMVDSAVLIIPFSTNEYSQKKAQSVVLDTMIFYFSRSVVDLSLTDLR
jgi:hypothetical protein